jgi:hypothetical protein
MAAQLKASGELESLCRQERERAQRAEAALARERERADMALAEERERVLRLEAERAGEQVATPDAAASAVATAVSGPFWGAPQQYVLATALAGFSDWGLALREAVKTLGAQGEWGLACAWAPDERLQRLRCAATWADPAAELAQLETATWQELPALHASPQGLALHEKPPQWLAELDPGDRRFNAVSAHGMSCGLLIPVHDGTEPVALIELLGRNRTPPDAEQHLAFAAIGVQLGHLRRLARLGAEPRWGSGRV